MPSDLSSWIDGIYDSIRCMVEHMINTLTNDQIHKFYQDVKNADSLTTIQYLYDTGLRVDNQPVFTIKYKDIHNA